MNSLNQAAPVIGRYRWRICALLFFATTINYMDRQILALINTRFSRANPAAQVFPAL